MKKSSLPVFRKKQAFIGALFLLIAGCLVTAWVFFANPEWVIKKAIHWSGQPLRVGKVSWLDRQTLVLEDLRLGAQEDYAQVAKLTVTWRWGELLWARKIELIELEKPVLLTGRLTKELARQSVAETAPHEDSQFLIEIGQLRIRQGRVILENLAPGLPPIPVTLGRDYPLTLTNLKVGDEGEQLIEAEANQIIINSPLDALSPVLQLETVKVACTWKGLLRHEIEKLEFIRPIVFVGPDLFWFGDELKKGQKANAQKSEPWQVKHFEVRAGQVALNNFGAPTDPFPFYFKTVQQNVNLLDLTLSNNQLLVYRPVLEYPALNVRITGANGKLEFDLPPGDQTASNVVPTIFFEEVAWKEIKATETWASVTFTREGIFGKLGGKCHDGYIDGGFSFLLQEGNPWEGWVNMSGVDMESVIKKLAPEYFSITGGLSGKFQAKGRMYEVLESNGKIQLLQPGKMQIKAIDELLAKLPEEWGQLKQDMVTILLQAFRDYDYTLGELEGTYRLPESKITLTLEGKQGRRTFTVNWHQRPRSKMAKTEEKKHNSTLP